MQNNGIAYTMLNDMPIIGYATVQKPGVGILAEPSFTAMQYRFLNAVGMKIGVIQKIGNFCLIEGGGYIYIDTAKVTYQAG